MVDSKKKGNRWEGDAMKILNVQYPNTWKKIPGSGSLGTIMNWNNLRGDLIGKYYFLSKRIRADAKTGYGGATQLTIKREWLSKIREEAEANISDIPCLICKFSGSRTDVRYFVALDFDAWHELLGYIEELYTDNIALLEKIHGT